MLRTTFCSVFKRKISDINHTVIKINEKEHRNSITLSKKDFGLFLREGRKKVIRKPVTTRWYIITTIMGVPFITVCIIRLYFISNKSKRYLMSFSLQ